MVPSDGLYYRVIDDEYTLACVKPAPGDVSNNYQFFINPASPNIPLTNSPSGLILMHCLKELVERSC